MTNPNKTIEKIEVYWTRINLEESGWIYCVDYAYSGEHKEGGLNLALHDNLCKAIEATCRLLDIDLDPNDFKIMRDGVYAIWQRPVETGMHYLDMKHTPGPWSLQAVAQDQENGGSYQPLMGHTSEWLADIRSNSDEEEANARLIKTSPKLLQALFCCVNVMKPGSVRDQAWVAIREATELEPKGGD